MDNPPFSIFAEIIRWYTDKGIKFFLFAPSLTIMNHAHICTAIATQVNVTYENGAKVATSFCTNLENQNVCARTAPDLFAEVKKADDIIRKEKVKELPKYLYPNNVATATMMGKWSKYGVDQKFGRESCILIKALDEQKEAGKEIYGSGLLLSMRAAAERTAAERAAAERAAAERAAARKWSLSNRELGIISELI